MVWKILGGEGRGELNFSTVWKTFFHGVENFGRGGRRLLVFFHGVEIIFPWRGKMAKNFSMAWKNQGRPRLRAATAR
jgi:hypothetical protein